MEIRILSDNECYVKNHDMNATDHIIPLHYDQVDLSTLVLHPSVAIVNDGSNVIVTKNGELFRGKLISSTDRNVVLFDGLNQLTIPHYDLIAIPKCIMVSDGNGNDKSSTSTYNASYITTGIVSYVVNSLELITKSTHQSDYNAYVTSTITISNNTPIDIIGAKLELLTYRAERHKYQSRAMLYQATSAPTSSNDGAMRSDTSTGTIYHIQGEHDIPKDCSKSLSLLMEQTDVEELYIIDVNDNGGDYINANYTLRWNSKSDLAGGKLNVYRDGNLETHLNTTAISKNQHRDITLFEVNNCFAQGIVSRTSINNNVSLSQVTIDLTLTSKVNHTITSLVRYYVGNSKVSKINNPNCQREGDYVIAKYRIENSQPIPHKVSFTIE